MAQGDVTFFDQFWEHLGNGVIPLSTGTFKMALLTSGTTQPVRTASNPAYEGGTQNYINIEVSAGGEYSAGGNTLEGVTWDSTANGATVFDSSATTWVTTSGNPTNAYWGLLYDDTTVPSTIKYAIAMVDLGGAFDMTGGDLTITPNAAGWFTEST